MRIIRDRYATSTSLSSILHEHRSTRKCFRLDEDDGPTGPWCAVAERRPALYGIPPTVQMLEPLPGNVEGIPKRRTLMSQRIASPYVAPVIPPVVVLWMNSSHVSRAGSSTLPNYPDISHFSSHSLPPSLYTS